MALGLGTLRLPPTSFWAMTPREFTAAARIGADQTQRLAPTRRDLATLMDRFPDIESPRA